MNMVKCPQCQMENPETEEYCSECGTPLAADKAAPPPPPQPQAPPIPPARPAWIESLARGSIFAERYKIMDFIGEGGAGKVYRVYDMARDRELALRLFHSGLSKEGKGWELFAAQLGGVRKVVHRNIARVFDFREEKGTPYVTSEYVSGQDLRERLRQTGRLDTRKITRLARQISFGLAKAHRAGILHLDLRPGNILLDEEDVVKVTDLGLAAAFFPKGTTDSGALPGSKEYLSPEQLAGKEVDERSDIYSLGVVLFEMAIGEVPHKGESPAELLRKQESEEPPNPRELNPLVSEGLSRLILKCLEKEAAKRYQMIEELLLDLENAAAEEEAAPEHSEAAVSRETKPAPVKPSPRPGPARALDLKKIPVAAIAGVALIFIGFLLWRLVLHRPNAPSASITEPKLPSLVVMPFKDLDPLKEAQAVATGITEALNEALAGVSGLRVLSRTSHFSLGYRRPSSQEIEAGQEVEYSLTGEMRAAQDGFHIAAKLVDRRNGAAIWFKEYNPTWETLPAALEEIAKEAISALRISSSEGAKPEVNFPSADREALLLYWQGKELWNRQARESLEESVEFFTKAAAKDPAFALARAGVAYSAAALGSGRLRPPAEVFPKAKTAVLDALQADPNLSEAHALLAFLKSEQEWDRATAEREYREAIRLKPGNAWAHQAYALLLSCVGRHQDALAEISLARTLDPLSSEIQAEAGVLLYFARQYDQALAELAQTRAASPESASSYLYSGLVCVQLQRFEEALAAFDRAAELGADPMDTRLNAAYVYALQGKRSEVGRLLSEALGASKESYAPSVGIAAVYAAVGEKDQAFASLEKALLQRDPALTLLKVHPFFDVLRGDPRFADTLKKIGLA